jgi:hypothetical protein
MIKIKEDEMGGVCGMHGRKEKRLKYLDSNK